MGETIENFHIRQYF